MIKAKGTKNMFLALEKQVKQFKDSAVKIGLPEKEGGKAHKDSNLTIAQIGAIHEFGVPEKGIEKRSFLREPMMDNQKKIQKLVQTKFNAIINNRITATMALDQLGEFGMNLSKESFRDNSWKANADITVNGGWMTKNGKSFYVKGKGTSAPLVATGQLRNSITYIVEKR